MKKKLIILAIVAIVAALIPLGGRQALAGDLYVDDDDVTCGGNSPCYATIQEAINAASAGDTINVAAGNYQETIDLGSDQSGGFDLIGEGKDVVFWQPVLATDRNLWRDNRSNNLDFRMEITGFTFVGGLDASVMVGIYKNGYASGTGDCFLDIHDNNFVSQAGTTNSNYGLFMCKTRVDRNLDGTAMIKIYDNVFQCVSGICMSGTTNFDIYDNDFSYDIVGNGICARKNCAMYVGDPCTSGPTVRGGHHIHDNVFAHVGDGYMETIDDVSYYDTIDEYLAAPRAAVIIEGSDAAVTSLPNLVEDNIFNNPNGAGIHYESYGFVSYSSYVLAGETFTEQRVRHNDFDSHIKAIFSQAYTPGEEILVNAECNWWGAVDGPSGVGSGSGDAVSGYVDFEPWLVNPWFLIDHAKFDFKKKSDDDKAHVKGKLAFNNIYCGCVDLNDGGIVTVTVGTLSETFEMETKGKKGEKWEYKRPKHDEGNLKHMKIDWKKGEFDIRIDNADFSGLTNPVSIGVQVDGVGDCSGEQTILMKEKKSHWDYKAPKH